MNDNSSITSTEYDVKELDNIILCAKWLVAQLEDINCTSIASLFQHAVDDAEAWVQNMIHKEDFPENGNDPIQTREAESIRKILVKYATISDPGIRENVLSEMISLTNKKHH